MIRKNVVETCENIGQFEQHLFRGESRTSAREVNDVGKEHCDVLEQLGFAAPDGSQFTDDPFRQDIAQQLRGFFLLALQRLLEFEQLQIVFDYGEALVERRLALGGQRSFKGGVSLPFFRQLLLEAGDFLAAAPLPASRVSPYRLFPSTSSHGRTKLASSLLNRLNRTMWQSAATPSFQPIFLPSSKRRGL